MQFDEQRGALRAYPRAVLTADRIPKVEPGWIRAMLIRKFSLQNQDFFSTAMLMSRKFAIGRIAELGVIRVLMAASDPWRK